MKIKLEKATRKFGAQIVFNDLNAEFNDGERYAFLGGNGSGKSTLLKVVYGALSLSKGSLTHQSGAAKLSPTQAAHRMTYNGPYYEVIEELKPLEFLNLIGQFKAFRKGENEHSILEKALLSEAKSKSIKQFSSGMKQRLKLAAALLFESEAVLLDEPISNLDPAGVKWFKNLLNEQLGRRSLFVASNFNEDEIFLCDKKIELKNHK